ncbi:KR domain-containing protein [Chloroflexi bacterium TSY]|nr:KR domain-containing protein [Chloroflexi bacterium TSY]
MLTYSLLCQPISEPAPHGVKKLVLMGREALPPRAAWSEYLLNPAGDTTLRQKIADIQDLEEAGAEVLVLTGSLTNRTAMLGYKERVKAKMGPIFGVIHCAGLVSQENPAFIRKPLDEIRAVCAPKVEGLDVLHELFATETLHFFVLFSSVSAIVPTLGAGQSDYAMANAYMDYFATHQQGQGRTHYVSIQWPNWQETGMGLVQSDAYRQSGLCNHTDEEGLTLLDAVLALKPGPVVLPAVARTAQFHPEHLLMPHLVWQEAAASLSLDGSSVLYTKIAEWLGSLLSQELKLSADRLEMTLPFQAYGVDSILLAQLVARIDRELPGVKLDPSLILMYPTLQSLSEYLVKTYPEALAALFKEPAMTAEKGKPLHRDLENILNQNRNSLTESQWPKSGGLLAAVEPSAKATAKIASQTETQIAVVGMACHFPDAPTLQHYWDNLKHGRDSICEVPDSRWTVDDYYDPNSNQRGKSISKWGAFLADIEAFDPHYFGISEALASQIDPLERQWLEVSVEALADAGYEKEDLWGQAVGIFVGSRVSNFADKLETLQKDALVGLGQNFIAAHLAHLYNFKGPNMVVDTACASSLTAIHLAMQSISRGESTVALAGGVDILLDEAPYIGLSAAQVLSPDGRCKTFDENANGIGIGEGCGVLVLKSLDQAIADGNKIYGEIEGSAINQDGYTMGVTTPNPEAQQALIETVLREAQVDPRTITYVETHGTGTLIGDPIELKGLTDAFGQAPNDKQFCGVGSVKSNIGHLLSAAGAAGIIKVLLSITHKALPPTLHCEHPNPRFNFAESPFYPVRQLTDWAGEAGIHRAGVSAFGLGGHNAHLIVSGAGIPSTQRASLEPRGVPVVFNRRRYWPTGWTLPPANGISAAAIDDERECHEELIRFFEEDLEIIIQEETV